MYHLLSIIATLSLVSAVPLPQYNLALSSDIDTIEPWGTTAIDTANPNTYRPNSPFILSEDPGWSRNVEDRSWTGKNRRPSFGDRSGMGDPTENTGFSQEALDYWRARGFPRIQPKDEPATPQQDEPPAPLPINDAGSVGAATAIIKGILDGAPPGLNPLPAGGY